MKSPYIGKFKVSQEFKGSAHDGLDLVGLDSKEIHSTVDGIVERAGWENSANHSQGFGLYVRIKQNGSDDRYYYGHLSKINIKKGQSVKIGDVIGAEGSTGRSTGSHCHYCVRGNALKSEIRDICKLSGIPNTLGIYCDNTAVGEVDVLSWQQAAVGDGFTFPKYGTDGKWGAECEDVAKKAVCKKRAVYKYKNLTRLVQEAVGVTADGKFGKNTHNAVVRYQSQNGLTPDGCVGIKTWKKLLGVN